MNMKSSDFFTVNRRTASPRREAVGSVSRSLSELESSYVLVSVPLMRNLEDMDYWWLGEGSTDAYGVAKASPSGLEFKSVVVDNAGGTAPVRRS